MDSLIFLAALIMAAIGFVTFLSGLIGRWSSKLLIGGEMVVLISLLWFLRFEISNLIGADFYVSQVANGLATLWWLSVAFLFNAITRRFVWEGVFWHNGECTVPKLLTDAASVFIYLATIMVTMHFVYEKPITAVAATSGAVAFIFGYSAKETLSDVFAGLSLSATHTLEKGDWVEIDGAYGKVRDMNWRAVTIFSSRYNSHIIIPNSKIAQDQLINFGQPYYYCRDRTEFITEPNAPPELVVRSVTEALKHGVKIRKSPGPDVHLIGYTEWGPKFLLRWRYDGQEARWKAKDEAHYAIWSALKREGISFAYNKGMGLPDREFGESRWSGRQVMDTDALTSYLAKIEPFMSLEKPALKKLAACAKTLDFMPPERITRQAQGGDALYLITEGLVFIYLEKGEEEMKVGELTVGDVFGLVSALDGAPRKVAAQADRYTVVYAFDRNPLLEVIAEEPDLAAALRGISAKRHLTYSTAFKHEKIRKTEITVKTRKRLIVDDLAENIKGFFGKQGFIGIARRQRSKRVMEAVMAAAALVSTVDGTVRDCEKEATLQVFKDLKLLEHFDSKKGLTVFNKYIDLLLNYHDHRPVWSAIKALSGDMESGRLVLGVCHAISASDGSVDWAEEERITEIKEALDIDDAELGSPEV